LRARARRRRLCLDPRRGPRSAPWRFARHNRFLLARMRGVRIALIILAIIFASQIKSNIGTCEIRLVMVGNCDASVNRVVFAFIEVRLSFVVSGMNNIAVQVVEICVSFADNLQHPGSGKLCPAIVHCCQGLRRFADSTDGADIGTEMFALCGLTRAGARIGLLPESIKLTLSLGPLWRRLDPFQSTPSALPSSEPRLKSDVQGPRDKDAAFLCRIRIFLRQAATTICGSVAHLLSCFTAWMC